MLVTAGLAGVDAVDVDRKIDLSVLETVAVCRCRTVESAEKAGYGRDYEMLYFKLNF
ncbi:hypothetical protein D3C87_1893380 [compost metagenome]